VLFLNDNARRNVREIQAVPRAAYRSPEDSVLEEGANDWDAAASPACRDHRDFHDMATPERNRFFVKRSPSGEMAMVNNSPSISISRRMVLSSLVDMSLYT
jgi:hypothetical protein